MLQACGQLVLKLPSRFILSRTIYRSLPILPPTGICGHVARASNARTPLAFVLDIDGVLVRGPNVLPAAKRALAMLDGNNPFGTKIPYVLLTNGGGVSEAERCRKLTKHLGVEIKSNQCIQAHTILKILTAKYADAPVLLLGGKNNALRPVVEGYGFKKAYTTLDILAWNPSIWPFHQLTPIEQATAKEADFSQMPISAILVLHDPLNWGLDIQVICDVIQSGGIVGGPYKHSNKSVELIFCNSDLLWRSDYDHPRFGQGAFIAAFQAVFKALTGSVYPYVQYGKPTEATYKFAESILMDCVEEMQGHRYSPEVYMIGDNPESDIAGANAAKMSSILVRTGVFDPRQGPPKHQPTYEAEDVEEAVRWAIDRELKKVDGNWSRNYSSSH